jgi:hypothetical protein
LEPIANWKKPIDNERPGKNFPSDLKRVYETQLGCLAIQVITLFVGQVYCATYQILTDLL